MNDFKLAEELFSITNEIASKTTLKDLTVDDINQEIKEYRLEKKTGGDTQIYEVL